MILLEIFSSCGMINVKEELGVRRGIVSTRNDYVKNAEQQISLVYFICSQHHPDFAKTQFACPLAKISIGKLSWILSKPIKGINIQLTMSNKKDWSKQHSIRQWNQHSFNGKKEIEIDMEVKKRCKLHNWLDTCNQCRQWRLFNILWGRRRWDSFSSPKTRLKIDVNVGIYVNCTTCVICDIWVKSPITGPDLSGNGFGFSRACTQRHVYPSVQFHIRCTTDTVPWILAQCWGTIVWIKITLVQILCWCQTVEKFVHSTLLQFTQLYEWIPGYRQWWIFVY